MSENVNHTGVVERIADGIVYVRIIQQSACGVCEARKMCITSESKKKIIEVPDNTGRYQINEEVELCGRSSMGLEAVVIAFVLPMIILIGAVAIGSAIHWKETTSGLAAILLLVPYYGILYLFRERLKKTFVFTLRKLN